MKVYVYICEFSLIVKRNIWTKWMDHKTRTTSFRCHIHERLGNDECWRKKRRRGGRGLGVFRFKMKGEKRRRV